MLTMVTSNVRMRLSYGRDVLCTCQWPPLEAMTRSLIPLMTILLVFANGELLPAQGLILGGGLNVGTIPRALEPLCGAARRLRGIGVAARAGVATSRLQVDAKLDY